MSLQEYHDISKIPKSTITKAFRENRSPKGVYFVEKFAGVYVVTVDVDEFQNQNYKKK